MSDKDISCAKSELCILGAIIGTMYNKLQDVDEMRLIHIKFDNPQFKDVRYTIEQLATHLDISMLLLARLKEHLQKEFEDLEEK